VRLALLVTVLATAAAAQDAAPEASAPPIVPAGEPETIPQDVVPANPPLSPEPADARVVSYSQRCFAIPGQVWIPLPSGRYSAVPAASTAPLSSFHAAAPVSSTGGSGGSGSSSSGSSGGGGLGDGKALIVIAVVIIAALPVVIYALDDDAPAVVEQRFHCPTFGIDLIGGADFGSFGAGVAGSGRFNFGFGYFGFDGQFDLSTQSVNTYAGHLMLRIGPKKHIQPNIAVGFRYMSFQGRQRFGFEVGVPHKYVFWRSGLREFGLELRPMFLFGSSVFDVGVEAAFLIPLVEPINLRAGGKVQTFGNEVIGGVNVGLSFNL
jgi:hypothetical protein